MTRSKQDKQIDEKIDELWNEFLSGDMTVQARDEYKAKVAVLESMRSTSK